MEFWGWHPSLGCGSQPTLIRWYRLAQPPAGSWDASKEGTGNSYVHGVGSTIGYQNFLPVDKLKAGSLYVTTPSINFLWGIDARPKR